MIPNKKKMFIILSVFAVFTFASYAFAMNHMGNKQHGQGNQVHGMGMGMGMGASNNSCRFNYNYMAENFSEEDINEIETERDRFLALTTTIRKNIYTKKHELQKELSKENPDINKTWELREEIFSLKTEVDKKRFDCIKTMKEINPKAGAALMGMGKDKMRCKMMGGM